MFCRWKTKLQGRWTEEWLNGRRALGASWVHLKLRVSAAGLNYIYITSRFSLCVYETNTAPTGLCCSPPPLPRHQLWFSKNRVFLPCNLTAKNKDTTDTLSNAVGPDSVQPFEFHPNTHSSLPPSIKETSAWPTTTTRNWKDPLRCLALK